MDIVEPIITLFILAIFGWLIFVKVQKKDSNVLHSIKKVLGKKSETPIDMKEHMQQIYQEKRVGM